MQDVMALKFFNPLRAILQPGLITIGVVLCCAAVQAAELPQPEGRVLLTVSGKIKHSNGNGQARFDRAMLEALPGETLRTNTPWTKKVTEFHGPLARALLEFVGAHGEVVQAFALNDYAVEVPVGDMLNYRVILAMAIDGEQIGVRSRGPIWLMYPWDDNPELKNDRYYARSIWQLKEIIVK